MLIKKNPRILQGAAVLKQHCFLPEADNKPFIMLKIVLFGAANPL
jgi:hypothetical protein